MCVKFFIFKFNYYYKNNYNYNFPIINFIILKFYNVVFL